MLLILPLKRQNEKYHPLLLLMFNCPFSFSIQAPPLDIVVQLKVIMFLFRMDYVIHTRDMSRFQSNAFYAIGLLF